MKNSINQDICIKCKMCIKVCPVNYIGFVDNKVIFDSNKETICLKCGQCMAVCSTYAIQVADYNYNDDIFPLKNDNLKYDDFINFLSSRRTIRNYKQEQISEDVISKIVESVKYAPYGASPNKMELTIINNRAIIEKALPYIEKFLDSIVEGIENPIARIIIKQKVGLETFNTIKNHLYPISKSGNYKLELGDRISRGAPALIIFHANKSAEEHSNNGLIYATYTMLVAHSLGLGAGMNGIISASINRIPEVKELFKIPKANEAVISLMVGYPRIKYKKGIRREFFNTTIVQ